MLKVRELFVRLGIFVYIFFVKTIAKCQVTSELNYLVISMQINPPKRSIIKNCIKLYLITIVGTNFVSVGCEKYMLSL